MEYKEYTTTIEKLAETLEQYGVAVIPNVLNEDEIDAMKRGMWETLENLTKNLDVPIKANNKKSWTSFYKLLPIHSMLLQHFKVGHAQFVWDIRQNPKVVDIFSKLWKCEPDQLITSFDGISIHFPPEITGQGWYKSKDWFHTDQSYTRNDLECIQAFASAYDVREGDATLTILEGSHKYHKDFATDFNVSNPSDWYKLSDDEHKYYLNKGCKRYCVKCPAGSMVFWDSRTIHAGIEAQQTRKKQNTRLVVYVCQTPVNLANGGEIKKRQAAFNEMRMTSHWPHKIKLFPKYPHGYGNDISDEDMPVPKLSELGLKLAGF